MIRSTRACKRWCKYMIALFLVTFIITAGFMSRQNDIWVMNSLSFDNVVAIQERRAVSAPIMQFDSGRQEESPYAINKSDTNGYEHEGELVNQGVKKVGDFNAFINGIKENDIKAVNKNISLNNSQTHKDTVVWEGEKNDKSNDNVNEVHRRFEIKINESFGDEMREQEDTQNSDNTNERLKFWQKMKQPVR